MTLMTFDYFNISGKEIDQFANLERKIRKPNPYVWEYGGIMTNDNLVMGIVWQYPDEKTFSISVLLEDPVTKVFHAVFSDRNFATQDYASTALIREVRRIWGHECAWADTE